MPAIKTQINCPNCRQQIITDLEQIFDAAQDPASKQRLLSGAFNVTQCPHCGYQGNLAAPLVFHDPSKELLLTFVPPELNMPRDEQERAIGRLITQVMNDLPTEQRKGYLLNPQAVLTLKGLVERILESDGITKEMIEEQQKRVDLIQRLINASDDVIEEVAKQEDELMDASFFALLSRLAESTVAAGDENAAKQLVDLQAKLVPLTTFGREYQEQAKEIEAAVKSLQDEGEGITREKLLELVLEAPNETRVDALASLARPGMDYVFFQMLTERIESETPETEEHTRLTKLRERLLEITREIDQQVEARMTLARSNLEAILNSENITQVTEQNLAAIDNVFIQVLNEEYRMAEEKKDQSRIDKLQLIMDVISKASTPPAYVEIIEEMLSAEDDEARDAILEKRKDEIGSEIVDATAQLLTHAQSRDDKELAERLRTVHRALLRYTMKAQMAQNK